MTESGRACPEELWGKECRLAEGHSGSHMAECRGKRIYWTGSSDDQALVKLPPEAEPMRG